MEKHHFSCIFPLCDAVSRGSLTRRGRVYPLIVAVHPEVWVGMQGEKNFFELHNALKVHDALDFSHFAIDDDVLQRMCEPLQFGSRPPMPATMLMRIV